MVRANCARPWASQKGTEQSSKTRTCLRHTHPFHSPCACTYMHTHTPTHTLSTPLAHVHAHTHTHTHSHNQDDLLTSCRVWLERGKPLPPKLIRVSARIGINSSGPVWSMADLRFYQLDCTSVSKPGNRGRTALSRVSREKNIISK